MCFLSLKEKILIKEVPTQTNAENSVVECIMRNKEIVALA